MDKESLKKHQFWYLLGGATLLCLILWLSVMFGMSGAAEEVQKKYDAAKKGVTGAKQPKNASFLPPWQAHQKIFADQKDGVWKKAWETQQDLYTWPEGDRSVVEFNKWMAYPAEVVKEAATDEGKKKVSNARREYKLIYAKQFKSDDPLQDLEKSVAPAVFNGGATGFATIMGPTTASGGASGAPDGERPRFGPAERPGVGFGGDRPRFAPGAPGGPGGAGLPEGVAFNTLLESTREDPALEEIWILQEDFWVKKEMLRIVREVQQGAARFKRVEDKDDPKEVRRFRNGTWEFKFVVEGNKISNRSTLKNISPARAALPLGSKESRGLRVQLRQGDSPPLVLEVAGEPVPFDGPPLEFKESDPKGWEKPLEVTRLDLSQPFDLEQVLDWSTAPVRRIDALRTAKHSHRTAKSTLVPYPPFKPPDDSGGAAAKSAAGAGTSGGAGSGAPGGAGPGGPGDKGLGDEKGAVGPPPSGTEVYGLERNRYIIATDQSRHLPIAMVFVVEQSHVNDVLIAIANSPLRIQTTQVAFHDMPLRSPTSTSASGEPGAERPGWIPMVPPVRDEKKPPVGPSFGPGGVPGGPQPGTQPGTTAEEVDTNLVELTVYGIATLYERYKEKTSEGPATPGAPQPGPQPGKP
jgi:hypothetical protein